MNTRTVVLIAIVFLAAVSRLLPHPPNFVPITAMTLFGAAYFRSLWAAFLVPQAAMLASTIGLEIAIRMGWFSGWMSQGTGFYEGMWVQYLAILLISCTGLVLRKWKNIPSIACTTLASAIVFFLVTNFGDWLVRQGERYPMTLAGLLECYEMGIPFFRMSLLGDAFYVLVLFGGFALAEHFIPALRLERPEEVHAAERVPGYPQ